MYNNRILLIVDKEYMLDNKEDIKAWLDKYYITDYHINEDLTVDVNGNVWLTDKKLTTIDVQFNIVNGHFNCSLNQLTTLKGCPKTVVGNFVCSQNQLKSLESGPKMVAGNYVCHNNQLKSLEGSPKNIKGKFDCSDNQLINLIGCPISVEQFECNNNKLTTLEFCPETITYAMWCNKNKLTTLKYSPKSVGGGFYCSNNPIKTIQDFNCTFRNFSHSGNLIPMLEDYYNFSADNKCYINISYETLHKALLYDKLNSNINNKEVINKKCKI